MSDHSGLQASQDQDDEPSPVTLAVPAASVSPESLPPAPPELISGNDDCRKQSITIYILLCEEISNSCFQIKVLKYK